MQQINLLDLDHCLNLKVEAQVDRRINDLRDCMKDLLREERQMFAIENKQSASTAPDTTAPKTI